MTAHREQRSVAVIGAGIAGLYAATQLQRAGIDIVLLEAQSRIGGRVSSVELRDAHAPSRGTYDLGPTWYWPTHNPRMVQLLAQLTLPTFAQYDDGALLYELADGRVHRVGGGAASDGARRVAGGMRALVEALAAELSPSCLMTDRRLRTVQLHAHGVELHVANARGDVFTMLVDAVISTLPPRLLASSVSFHPALPGTVLESWSNVPTWMAPHAKFLAVYDTPFWRDADLSGQVRSQRGPLVEIHDATAHHGLPALFGFLGVSAADRAAAGDVAIQQSALAQLQRIFGVRAATPVATYYKDWAADACLATVADMRPPHAHPDYGTHEPLPRDWAERFVVAGSETSAVHGGYLEGALEAATVAVAHILTRVA